MNRGTREMRVIGTHSGEKLEEKGVKVENKDKEQTDDRSNERRYNEEEKREGTGRKDEGGATLVGRERLGTFIKRKKNTLHIP